MLLEQVSIIKNWSGVIHEEGHVEDRAEPTMGGFGRLSVMYDRITVGSVDTVGDTQIQMRLNL